jgi:hypothetical protein
MCVLLVLVVNLKKIILGTGNKSVEMIVQIYFMKVGAKVIPEWLVPVLLRLHLTVLTFPEMCGVPFNIYYYYYYYYYYYLKMAYLIVYVVVYLCVCIPYMCRKTYWMRSALTQVYKAHIPPCTERSATVLQDSDIFI